MDQQAGARIVTMGLIQDIQAAAISQSTDVPTLLRMCKLLAARLGNKTFADWVEHELHGYPDAAELPPYRVAPCDNYGYFGNAVRTGQRLQIPVSILPKELREHYQEARLQDSASAYVHLIAGDLTGTAKVAWPIGMAVHYASKIANNAQCTEAWKEIPIGAFVRLLDAVKAKVLGFAIDLERISPDAGDMPIGAPSVSQDKVTQIFNMNIGSVGNLSNAATNVTQLASVAVSVKNWGALHQTLQSLGIPDADLQEVRPSIEAAASDPAAAAALVANTSGESLIGKLAAKASSGALGVGVEVASAAIARALAMYLGIPQP